MTRPIAMRALLRRRGLLILLTLALLIGGVIGWQGRKRWRELQADSAKSSAEQSRNARRPGIEAAAPLPRQTQVATATHGVDESGIPYLEVENIGRVRHPVTTALYALGYAGRQTYYPGRAIVPRDRSQFVKIVDITASMLEKTPHGDWVWYYPFDNTYNDITIKKPWFSGFGQAVGIEALVASFEINSNTEHLDAAVRAARVFFRPVAEGGLLFQKGDDVFFEEIPHNPINPPHILNGHMRVLIALGHLHRATQNPLYAQWRDRGLDTLERWLPLYDAGYWLRYDLNLKKRELTFRLVSQSGNHSAIAVDTITLTDPQTGERAVLDVGAEGDAVGPLRIAGLGWSPVKKIDGRSVRYFWTDEQIPGGKPAEQAFVYLTLPGQSEESLRTERYNLDVTFLDQQTDELHIEIKSIAPGPEYRRLENGTMLCRGDNTWRKVRIAVMPAQLGWWVGRDYGRNHAIYLDELARDRPSLKPWADKAWNYYLALFPKPVKWLR